MAAANQRLGEYILIDRIGSGAFGEVWRARHHAWADQIVAIKIPTDSRYASYLQKEGAAIGRLVHPTIVKAIAFDPYHDPAYLAMEYVQGPNLRQIIQTGPLPVSDAVAIMKQVLSALHQAHGHNIIHRDIKPENILINEKLARTGYNKPGAVKLSDFGLGSTDIQNPNSIVFSTDRQNKPQIVGSAPYMSPEQRDGNKIDARSDLYSCGIVLFEMLTGRRPAGAESPSEVNPKVPKAIDEVFRKAYSHVDRRFASAKEFFDALKSASGDQKRDGIGRRRFEKKLLWLATAACAVMAAIIWIMPVIFSPKHESASETRPPSGVAHTSPPIVIPGERPTAPADRGSPRTDNTGPAQPPTPEVTTQPPPLIPPPTPPAPQTLPPASRPAVAISTTPPATGPSPTAPYAAELARHKAAAAAAQAKYDAAFTDDPAYQQAKAAAGQAKAAVDSLGDTATPGSPDLVAASQKLVDAKAALAKESSRVTATQRQLQVTILLETAKANDTQVSGHVALGALNDLLRLDPQNAEALALQGKISAYYTVRNSLGMTLIAIAPGRFLMGSPANEKDRSDDETQHAVTLTKGFFMGTTHVTVAQFAAFAQNANYQTDAEKQGWATGWNGSGWAHINGSSWRKPQEEPEYTQADDHPVVSVSWNDAVAFCDWLSKKEGEHYRLPTEAEFEYAARAGTQTAYWWSSNPDDGLGCANLIDRTASMKIPNWSAGAFHWSDGYYFTSPVGKFRANAWGLYDMVGNAWEWCNDWYGGYPQGDATDPTGPAVGTERTARGSGWSDFPKTSRCAMRGKCAPSDGQDFIGFRVVLDSE